MSLRPPQPRSATRAETNRRTRLDAVLDQGIRAHYGTASEGVLPTIPPHVHKAYAVIQRQPWTTMSCTAQGASAPAAQVSGPFAGGMKPIPLGGNASAAINEAERRRLYELRRWWCLLGVGLSLLIAVFVVIVLLATGQIGAMPSPPPPMPPVLGLPALPPGQPPGLPPPTTPPPATPTGTGATAGVNFTLGTPPSPVSVSQEYIMYSCIDCQEQTSLVSWAMQEHMNMYVP